MPGNPPIVNMEIIDQKERYALKHDTRLIRPKLGKRKTLLTVDCKQRFNMRSGLITLIFSWIRRNSFQLVLLRMGCQGGPYSNGNLLLSYYG